VYYRNFSSHLSTLVLLVGLTSGGRVVHSHIVISHCIIAECLILISRMLNRSQHIIRALHIVGFTIL